MTTGSKDDFKDISFINEIKSIAVIGVSKKRNFFFLRNHTEYFQGNVYAIHPTLKSIPDFPDENIYKSILDVPEPIEFVFITVPRELTIEVMKECVEKGVKLATVFTANFSDEGTPEGAALEKNLIEAAANKVRILGPNGLGLYYPKLGIHWRYKFPHTPGNIGLVSQSGGLSNLAIYSAQGLGIAISKAFSFGNGTDVDFIDILHYLCNDPETEIILCYLEGIKNHRGPALKRVLEKNKKPIVFLKGGNSERGSFAAKTHTASLSGNNKLWHTIFKQYNIIEVESVEQLLSTARLLDFYGIRQLNNIAVLSISGGYGVVLVDLIEKYGMRVPDFSEHVEKELVKKFFLPGTSPRNPLDIAAQMNFSESIIGIIDTALSDEKIDALICDMPSWYFNKDYYLRRGSNFEENILNSFRLGKKHNKPVIPIIQRAHIPNESHRISEMLQKEKIAAYGDPLEFIPLLPKISNYKKSLSN